MPTCDDIASLHTVVDDMQVLMTGTHGEIMRKNIAKTKDKTQFQLFSIMYMYMDEIIRHESMNPFADIRHY